MFTFSLPTTALFGAGKLYCLEQTEVFPRLRWMLNFSSSGMAFR